MFADVPNNVPGDASSEVALVCRLTPAELEARIEDNSPLLTRVRAMRELPDGYRFAFSADPDGIPDLVGFILAERACCPFFTFELTFPAPHQEIWLTVRGREGVKEIVHDGFVAKVSELTNSQVEVEPAV
jgi:hypothetical protein